MCEGSPEADRREFLPVLRSHLRSLADASDPVCVSKYRGYVQIMSGSDESGEWLSE